MFLGIGAASGAETLRFPTHPRVEVRQLPYCPPGPLAKLHYVWFAMVALIIAVRWQPTWVYASDLLACPVALLLSFLPWVKLVYHEHDSPNYAPATAFGRLCSAARARLARRAQLCLLPNNERAQFFQQNMATRGPVLYVPNYPRLDEVAGPRGARDANHLRVYYHGTIVPPRLPLAVIRALVLLPPGVRLCVVGYETLGHLGYTEQLKTEAERVNVRDRVEFTGPMARRDLLPFCRQADVGLSLMPMTSPDVNMHQMAGASNKAFDYLACGVALLVADLPDWRKWYVAPGYGLACNPDDPASIAAALGWMLGHPLEMRAMGERGRRQVMSTWNYEEAFKPVLERLDAEAI